MLRKTIAQRYAEVLFRLSQKYDLVDEVCDELIDFNNLFQKTTHLRKFLEHPLIRVEKKVDFLYSIVKDKVSRVFLKFLELLVRKGRLKYLTEILLAYKTLVENSKGIVRVQVKSFLPLTSDEEEKLKKKLSWLGAKEIILESSVDPSLLGGMVIQIGNSVIDGSVSRQLENLRVHLLTRFGIEK